MAYRFDQLEPYEQLEQLIEAGRPGPLEKFWRTLPSRDLARAVSRLSDENHRRLLTMLDPDDAADLVDDLPVTQVVDLIEELEAKEAAAIFDELDSDDQVDLLTALDQEDAEAILLEMSPEEVEDVRRLSQYGPDTAGGLMRTEYLAYPKDMSVSDVLRDIRAKVDEDEEIDEQYLYILDSDGVLSGLVRLRELVLSPGKTSIVDLISRDAKSLPVSADLDEVDDFFDDNSFYAAPIVDDTGKLVGVLRRADAEEAMSERADKNMMRVGGIIAGEELRTMPLHQRTVRRLAFLVPTMLLTLVAVSVIAYYEATIDQVPALAIFLPLVAGLCGCAGNQAIAVSMREITLGLATKADIMRVLFKELSVGLLLGVALGVLVFAVSYAMRGNVHLAMVVGGAIPLTIMVAAGIGGTTPLVLRAVGIDPAMASGPLLTTVVDLTGFFTVLGIATLLLARLTDMT